MAKRMVICTISTAEMLGSTCCMVMANEPLPQARGGGHVLARPHGVGRGARDAREGRDVVDADGDDGVDDARAEHGRHHDGREDGGEGQREVGQTHDGFLDPPAARGRQQAQGGADHRADAHGDDAHEDGGAGAHQQQRGHVAPEGVGAQPVAGRGRAASWWPCPWRRASGASRGRETRAASKSSSGEHAADDEAAVVGARAARSPGRLRAAAEGTPGSGGHSYVARLDARVDDGIEHVDHEVHDDDHAPRGASRSCAPR